MRSCPICENKGFVDYAFKSYVTCTVCDHTYQPEPPPKTWQNKGEGDCNGYEGSTMNDHEKSANSFMANWIFEKYRPTSMLDIGCGYPYLSYCFKNMGLKTLAVDGAFKDGIIDNDLGVPTLPLDWENLEEDLEKVDLITMIHSFEHFKDPISCLKRVYRTLNDDGVVYLRSPNKNVAGIERDHTEGHAAIHPNIFGFKSLQIVANLCGFHIVRQEDSPGFGQTSWVLRKRPPKVSLFMIVKNEEGNIGKCLDSVKDLCDEMIVLDTGSTDNTVAEAEEVGATVVASQQFGPDTAIKDFHFAKARNEAMAYVDPNADWLFWMDADDTFEGSSLELSPLVDAYNVNIHYGNMRLHHARLFRSGFGVHFKGAIHEYPTIQNCRIGYLNGAHVNHTAGDKPGRTSRNTAILESELENDPDNKRTLFYLANSYREIGKTSEAIGVYRDYIARGGNFPDELFLAQYYVAMCYYQLGNYQQSIKEAFKAAALDDRWAESYCCIGECYYFLGDYKKAVGFLSIANEMPFPATGMFVRREMYGPVPRYWLSCAYEKLGDIDKAKEFAKGDENREKQLANRKTVIEMHRPGALGDVLATTPAVRELRKQNPNALLRYVTHKSSMAMLKHNPDIDEVVDVGGEWDRRISFDYPMKEGYPDVPMRKHLSHYFADCAGVALPDDWKPILEFGPGDIVKLEHKKPIITFAVRTGWSRYKEWPLERWEKLIERFKDYQFIQLGAPGEAEIKGAQYMCGKLTLRQSFCVLQQSALFIGLDSVFQHVAAALEVPAVVMFGSTSPQGSGYDEQINLASGDDCQPCYREDNTKAVHKKPPCPYSHKCMVDYMTVDRVAEAVTQKLKIHHEQVSSAN